MAVGFFVNQRQKDLPPEATLPGWNPEMEWGYLATLENSIYAGTAGVILFVAGLYLLRRFSSQKLNCPRT